MQDSFSFTQWDWNSQFDEKGISRGPKRDKLSYFNRVYKILFFLGPRHQPKYRCIVQIQWYTLEKDGLTELVIWKMIRSVLFGSNGFDARYFHTFNAIMVMIQQTTQCSNPPTPNDTSLKQLNHTLIKLISKIQQRDRVSLFFWRHISLRLTL